MIFVHEVHEVLGGRLEAFAESVRTGWQPLVEEAGEARLLWYWTLAHGTSASYRVVTLTAVRDWTAWGAIVARRTTDPRLVAWERGAWELRREVTAKILLPAPWSPLQEVDLAAPPAPAAEPAIYLHDTGWPFPGARDDYVAALGSIFYPQTQGSRMLTVVGCFVTAPGTGRHHEVVLLQRLDDWTRFAELLRRGEQGAQRGGWMEAGLRYRDRWESMLLRCAPWSPRQ